MIRPPTKAAAAGALTLCAILAGCSAPATLPLERATTAPTPSTAGPTPGAEAEPPGNDLNLTPIRIVVDQQVIDARLWDNPAAQSLVDQLPLTLDFSDHGGQEVLAEPPQPLTMAGMPAGESAPAGTIGYYAPAQSVVLYYSDVPQFSGIVRIGEMDGDLSVLRGWNSSRAVTIELTDDRQRPVG